MARHLTSVLTARYSHGFKGDEVAAINALPALNGAGSARQRATGTDDAAVAPVRLVPSLAMNHGQHKTALDPDRLI